MIEKNTVVLDVREYNELKDFRDKLKNGGVVIMEHHYGSNVFGGSHSKYYTTEEVVEQLTKKVNELKDKNQQLESAREKAVKVLRDVCNMGFIQLLGFYFSSNKNSI